MAIDLTDITDQVAKAWWETHYPENDMTDDSLFALKGALLSIISPTAELVEAAVRREIRVKIDTLPAADLGGLTVSKELALHAVDS